MILADRGGGFPDLLTDRQTQPTNEAECVVRQMIPSSQLLDGDAGATGEAEIPAARRGERAEHDNQGNKNSATARHDGLHFWERDEACLLYVCLTSSGVAEIDLCRVRDVAVVKRRSGGCSRRNCGQPYGRLADSSFRADRSTLGVSSPSNRRAGRRHPRQSSPYRNSPGRGQGGREGRCMASAERRIPQTRDTVAIAMVR